MAEITRGRAAHIVFAVPVAQQMFRCRGGGLSRAHSVGCPSFTPRQCVTTRELFFLVDVIFLQVALGSLPLFLPLRDTRASAGLDTLHRRGWEVKTKLLRECRRLFTGGDGGCVGGLSVVWCARSGCERCAIFPVGRCRTARRGLE